jgi:hypothetical protein
VPVTFHLHLRRPHYTQTIYLDIRFVYHFAIGIIYLSEIFNSVHMLYIWQFVPLEAAPTW